MEKDIINLVTENWLYVLAGIAVLSGVAYALRPKKDSTNLTNTSVDVSVKEEKYERRDISQLLIQELDDEVYTLKAKVEKVHSTANGYAGILSDEKAKMPFVYDNEQAFSDDIAGVLLHESRDAQSELDLHVEVNSEFDNDSSRILSLANISGRINGLTYETGNY